MLTIVTSGPKSAAQQARTALADAGFALEPADHDHGLPAHPEGKKVRQATAFLTIQAEDVDAVAATVAPLGYVLRMHHETAPPPEPSLAEVLAAMQTRIDTLERRLSDGG